MCTRQLRPRRAVAKTIANDVPNAVSHTVQNDVLNAPSQPRKRPASVLLSAFDDVERVVRVPRTLLEENTCRLSAVVERDEPVAMRNGQPVYSAGPSMPRAVLVSFLRSLTLGELVCSREVNMQELLAACEYEGVSVREVGLSGNAAPQLAPPPRGLFALESSVDGRCALHVEVRRLPRLPPSRRHRVRRR